VVSLPSRLELGNGRSAVVNRFADGSSILPSSTTNPTCLEPDSRPASGSFALRGEAPCPSVSLVKQSWTAQGAAAQRAIFADWGLLDDRCSRAMLTRPMAALSWVCGHLPRRIWSRSVTLAGAAGSDLWFDAAVAAALDAGVEQVATIGAGFDSRAWRFRRNAVRFFELDHHASQQEKVRRAPGPGPTYVEADLRADDPGTALVAAGFDPTQPACFVVESVTMYLQGPQVRRVLGQLAAVAATGSRLAVNFLPATPPSTASTRRQLRLQRLARMGSDEGFRFGVDPDEATALVAAAGWTVTEATTFRAAARTLLPADSGLPVDAIDERKTLLLAKRH